MALPAGGGIPLPPARRAGTVPTWTALPARPPSHAPHTICTPPHAYIRVAVTPLLPPYAPKLNSAS